jgi:hypothetical protein
VEERVPAIVIGPDGYATVPDSLAAHKGTRRLEPVFGEAARVHGTIVIDDCYAMLPEDIVAYEDIEYIGDDDDEADASPRSDGWTMGMDPTPPAPSRILHIKWTDVSCADAGN